LGARHFAPQFLVSLLNLCWVAQKEYALCCNLSLGFVTKARGLQGCGPKGSPGVTLHAPGSVGRCEGVKPHTPKAIPTWEMESRFIDLIPLHADGVRHTIGKLSTRATTSLWTSFSLEVCLQSYGAPNLRESQLWQFRDSHLGVLGQKAI